MVSLMRPEFNLFDGVHVVVTTRADGNQRPPEWRDDHAPNDYTRNNPQMPEPQMFEPQRSEQAQRAIVDLPWTFVRQVHGNVVVSIDESHGALDTEADAI